MKRTLREEITLRAHSVEGQGDGIWMVFIQMEEIIAAIRAYQRTVRKRTKRKVRKIR